METIGFIGLGKMGGNMAARYLAAGYTVYGEARNRDAAQWLLDQGMHWVDTPRQVAETADIVMTSLPDDSIVESVASGPDGILAGLGAGKLWADLSTISPPVSRRLAERVRGEGGGAVMLDTPVSGSVPQVKAGSLTIMVGGDKDGLRPRSSRSCASSARRCTSATTVKGSCSSSPSTSAWRCRCSLSQKGLLLAERDGIDPHLAAEVMTESAIGSPMLKARVPLVLDRTDETWFDIDLMHKDIRLARRAAAELATPLPSAAAADEILTRADELGYGHRDIAAVHEVLAHLSAASVAAP